MRLLIVEDDLDGREMLEEFFRLHRWEVTAVPSTSSGLELLRGGGFDVVISDEDLHGQSGSCMLREADREGLLRNVGVLMYTAEDEDLELPDGVRVLRKPLGIQRLLDEATALAPEAAPEAGAGRPSGFAAEAPSSTRARTSKKVHLVLYVTDSARSRRVLENLRVMLDDTPLSRVDVQVRNVAREAEGSDVAAHRPFTPFLTTRRPGEPECILGPVESERSLAQLIKELETSSPQSSPRAFAESPPPRRRVTK